MGHVQDRWYRPVPDPQKPGKMVRVPTARHGTGKRYKARLIGPDGNEISKTFDDGQRKIANEWLTKQQVDVSAGSFIDPRAGKVTVGSFAAGWLADLDIDEMSREHLEMRFRSRILPDLGRMEIAAATTSVLRGWDRRLREDGLSERYRLTLFTNLSALFVAARDDGLIAKNPFDGRSLRKPRPAKEKVVPWPERQVWAVQGALPERFRLLVDLAAEVGLRQGECFGLAVEDIDLLRGVVHVRRQVKTVRYKRVFALPKYDKVRDVPLSEPVKLAISAHLRARPAGAVTVPWDTPGGKPTTVDLIVPSARGLPIAANDFNRNTWKKALDAVGVPTTRYENGMHELRHFFASSLLDQGESIKAVAEWLGHTEPAFTLATYTHLMPNSDERTKAAIAGIYDRRTLIESPDPADGEQEITR